MKSIMLSVLFISLTFTVIAYHFIESHSGKKKPEKQNVIIIHDSIKTKCPDFSVVESKIQELLLQHYKAGWMDASNGVIELWNKDKLSDDQIRRLRNIHWRKIEKQIMYAK